MEEYIDVLNENGIKTGEVMTRKEIHKKGLWHRAIVVAIINKKNEVLLQQRSPSKDTNPNLWDISVSGMFLQWKDLFQQLLGNLMKNL